MNYYYSSLSIVTKRNCIMYDVCLCGGGDIVRRMHAPLFFFRSFFFPHTLRFVTPLADTRETEKVNRSANDFKIIDGEIQKCPSKTFIQSYTFQFLRRNTLRNWTSLSTLHYRLNYEVSVFSIKSNSKKIELYKSPWICIWLVYSNFSTITRPRHRSNYFSTNFKKWCLRWYGVKKRVIQYRDKMRDSVMYTLFQCTHHNFQYNTATPIVFPNDNHLPHRCESTRSISNPKMPFLCLILDSCDIHKLHCTLCQYGRVPWKQISSTRFPSQNSQLLTYIRTMWGCLISPCLRRFIVSAFPHRAHPLLGASSSRHNNATNRQSAHYN